MILVCPRGRSVSVATCPQPAEPALPPKVSEVARFRPLSTCLQDSALKLRPPRHVGASDSSASRVRPALRVRSSGERPYCGSSSRRGFWGAGRLYEPGKAIMRAGPSPELSRVLSAMTTFKNPWRCSWQRHGLSRPSVTVSPGNRIGKRRCRATPIGSAPYRPGRPRAAPLV